MSGMVSDGELGDGRLLPEISNTSANLNSRPQFQGLRTKTRPVSSRQRTADFPLIQGGPQMIHEVDLLASLNPWENYDLLDPAHNFKRSGLLQDFEG